MREDLAAIDSFPVEGAVWKLVEGVPAKLLGQKVLDAG